MKEILIERVDRIGKRTVWRENGRYFVSITNRSYQSTNEVTIETARKYYKKLRDE